ncbi:MAG: hypothetical protein RI967_1067 [Planctomycetota bacterium]
MTVAWLAPGAPARGTPRRAEVPRSNRRSTSKMTAPSPRFPTPTTDARPCVRADAAAPSTDPLSDAMREVQAFFEASGCPCAAANPEVLRAVVEERLHRAQRAVAERAVAKDDDAGRRAA